MQVTQAGGIREVIVGGVDNDLRGLVTVEPNPVGDQKQAENAAADPHRLYLARDLVVRPEEGISSERKIKKDGKNQENHVECFQ